MLAAKIANQRVALVTGGSKRVGRAIVERLAADNWRVIFTYFSSEGEAKEVESICISKVRANLGHLDQYEADIDTAVGVQLNLLVNCASVYKPDPSPHDPTFLAKIMTVNAEAPLRLARLFADRLRASGGHVINLIDILADRPDADLRELLREQSSAKELDAQPGARSSARSDR